MKVFLDTFVLIAVFYGDHTHYAASLDLYTWNVRHFSKFGPEVAGRIRMP